VIDPIKAFDEFKRALTESLGCAEPSVIVARRPCLLIAGKLRDYAKEQAAACSCESAEPVA